MSKLRTIFFDVGNTLLFPDLRRMLEPLRRRGVQIDAALWSTVERESKREFDQQEQTGTVDHGFWHIFYTRLLGELGIADPALLNELVQTVRISANWCEIRPGTREILERLAARLELAVISNADGKIADVLARCGIVDCFRTITDSGIVGKEKPHPDIFRAALSSMKAKAEDSLYVGDVYSVDYLGATGVGMKAILLDACGAYAGTDLPRIETLKDLEPGLIPS
jgi:putative hydrolase of the HAD superfamily